MLKTVKIILISLCVLLLMCCESDHHKLLKQADSVMESRPDSAMSLLSGIDRRELKYSDLPYYALLYTQAQIKTDVPLDSDSLISIAYAKYGDASKGDLGLRANFYTGEVFFNQEDHRQAMRYYLNVYEESKRLSDDYWHAKAAERISDLFYFAYNYDEAEKYAQEAANLFKKVGRQTFHRYTLGKQSYILLNNGKAEHAYILLDSLKSLTLNEAPVDSAFLNYITPPLTEAIIATGREQDLSNAAIDNDNEDVSEREQLEKAIYQSDILKYQNQSREALLLLLNSLELASSSEEKVHILYAIYDNSRTTDNIDITLSIVDSLLYYQNQVAEDIIQESIIGTQRDFYTEKSIILKNKSATYRMMVIVSCIVSILIILVMVTVVYSRNKVKNLKIKEYFEALMSLRTESEKTIRDKATLQKLLDEKQTESNDLLERIQALLDEQSKNDVTQAKIIETLFKEKWSTLDMLCNQYFCLNNSEITEKGIISNVEKEVKKIVSKKGLSEITKAVDLYMADIITLLREQCHFLKEEDIDFLALSFAGFSARTVCLFTGLKYKHYYVKKARLIDRIRKSDAPNKDLFLSKLN